MNVYQLYQEHGPGFWLRRSNWGNTIARVVGMGDRTGPPPYFGNPTVLMDVYDAFTGVLKDSLAVVRAPGTKSTYYVPEESPRWAEEIDLRDVSDPEIAAALTPATTKDSTAGGVEKRIVRFVKHARKYVTLDYPDRGLTDDKVRMNPCPDIEDIEIGRWCEVEATVDLGNTTKGRARYVGQQTLNFVSFVGYVDDDFSVPAVEHYLYLAEEDMNAGRTIPKFALKELTPYADVEEYAARIRALKEAAAPPKKTPRKKADIPGIEEADFKIVSWESDFVLARVWDSKFEVRLKYTEALRGIRDDMPAAILKIVKCDEVEKGVFQLEASEFAGYSAPPRALHEAYTTAVRQLESGHYDSSGLDFHLELLRGHKDYEESRRKLVKEVELSPGLMYLRKLELISDRELPLPASWVDELKEMLGDHLPDFQDRVDALSSAIQPDNEFGSKGLSDLKKIGSGFIGGWSKDANYFLVPIKMDVPLRTVVKFGRDLVEFSGSGRTFAITYEHPDAMGSHLDDYVGCVGAYYYFRNVLPEEVASLDKVPVIAAI